MEPILTGLRAVAEPSRLRLLALIADGELSVSDLVHILGISQPRVSRHLKVMSEAGLIDRQPEGARVFYRIATQGDGACVANAIVALLKSAPGTSAQDQLDRDRLAQLRQKRDEDAVAYFQANADRWDEIRRLSGAEEPLETAILARFAARSPQDLLDIGTGTGRLLERLAPLSVRAVGLDRSREMLALARANLDRAGISNAQVRSGDMYALPFDGDSFDAVLLHQVLHFAEFPALVIQESARVMRPGARLVIADLAPHDREDLRERHNHRRLGFETRDIAQWIAQAGLDLVETFDVPGPVLDVRIWVADRS